MGVGGCGESVHNKECKKAEVLKNLHFYLSFSSDIMAVKGLKGIHNMPGISPEQ